MAGARRGERGMARQVTGQRKSSQGSTSSPTSLSALLGWPRHACLPKLGRSQQAGTLIAQTFRRHDGWPMPVGRGESTWDDALQDGRARLCTRDFVCTESHRIVAAQAGDHACFQGVLCTRPVQAYLSRRADGSRSFASRLNRTVEPTVQVIAISHAVEAYTLVPMDPITVRACRWAPDLPGPGRSAPGLPATRTPAQRI